MAKTVVIVDDHPLVSQGISKLIETDANFEVVTSYQNPEEALSRIPIIKPDIILTDMDMPEMNGLELIQELRKQKVTSKMVLLTMHINQSIAKRVVELQLDAYLPKQSDYQEFLVCLNTVSSGNTYYSKKVMEALVSNSSNISEDSEEKKTQRLSNREKEILKLIVEGLNTREISNELHIAVRTTETHRKSIMKKIEVSNVAGMVRIAIQEGILN